MLEILEIDSSVGFHREDLEKTENVSSWNGRAVRLGKPDQKIDVVVTRNHHVDYSARVDVEWKWGGSEPSKGSVGVSGGASDDKGNSANLSIQRDSDGRTTASGSLEHSSQSATTTKSIEHPNQ